MAHMMPSTGGRSRARRTWTAWPVTRDRRSRSIGAWIGSARSTRPSCASSRRPGTCTSAGRRGSSCRPARRLDVAGLRARIAARLDWIPRFRQKVVRAPLGLAEPVWADDDAFDLEWHVRVARLDPAEPPGGARVRGLVDDFLGRPLDRSRPLWELLVVPQLA